MNEYKFFFNKLLIIFRGLFKYLYNEYSGLFKFCCFVGVVVFFVVYFFLWIFKFVCFWYFIEKRRDRGVKMNK